MTIGILNSNQFNAMNSIITLRAQELVTNMIVMDMADANHSKSGANAAEADHSPVNGAFSIEA